MDNTEFLKKFDEVFEYDEERGARLFQLDRLQGQ